MRITIDYDPVNNNFSVLVDRGTLSNGWPPTVFPPPPRGAEFQQITSWLNEAFEICLAKFKDQDIAAIRFKYDPKSDVQKEFIFSTKYEAPPPPPDFIKASFPK